MCVYGFFRDVFFYLWYNTPPLACVIASVTVLACVLVVRAMLRLRRVESL